MSARGKRLLAIDPMPVPSGAVPLVLMGPAPGAYLIPFLPPDIRALALKNNLVDPSDDNGLTRRMQAAIAAHDGARWQTYMHHQKFWLLGNSRRRFQCPLHGVCNVTVIKMATAAQREHRRDALQKNIALLGRHRMSGAHDGATS
jgi:hypothetical protein